VTDDKGSKIKDLLAKTNDITPERRKKLPHWFAFRFDRSIFAPLLETGSVRLGVRTQDFHSWNRGSIPLRTAKQASDARFWSFFYVFKQQAVPLKTKFFFSRKRKN
jgi:hypothetical protein